MATVKGEILQKCLTRLSSSRIAIAEAQPISIRVNASANSPIVGRMHVWYAGHIHGQ